MTILKPVTVTMRIKRLPLFTSSTVSQTQSKVHIDSTEQQNIPMSAPSSQKQAAVEGRRSSRRGDNNGLDHLAVGDIVELDRPFLANLLRS